MSENPRLIALLPVFNEEKSISSVLDALMEESDFVIAVDDGSTDGSFDLLRRRLSGSEMAALVRFGQNRGMSAGYRAGFLLALRLMRRGHFHSDDILFTFDADGQHKKEAIRPAARRLAECGLDLLLARRDFSNYPKYKILGNRGLTFTASLMSGYRYNDVECGMRYLRLSALEAILPYFTGYRFSCAQEIGVIAGRMRRRLKIDNDFEIEVPMYVEGARPQDGIPNVFFGFVALLRMALGLRFDSEARLKKDFEESALYCPSALVAHFGDIVQAESL